MFFYLAEPGFYPWSCAAVTAAQYRRFRQSTFGNVLRVCAEAYVFVCPCVVWVGVLLISLMCKSVRMFFGKLSRPMINKPDDHWFDSGGLDHGGLVL